MRPTVKLGKIAIVSAGNSAPQDEKLFQNGKYPFYRTADVGKVHYSRNLTEVKDYLNEEGIKGLKLYRKGTILFPKSGASTFLNHRVIMGQDGYVVSHLATISVNDDVDENFVYYYLTTVDAKDLCADQGYPSLKSSNIAEVEIPLPPLETQKAIVAKLDQIFAELDQTKSEIQKNLDNADELWKSSLNQAFQGDWEVKELGEIGIFIRGVSYKKGDLLPKRESGCISLLRSNNIQTELDLSELQYLNESAVKNEQITKKGDILFCMSNGSPHLVGKNILLPELENYSFGAFCSIFRKTSESVLSEYIAKYLQSENYTSFITSLSRGAGINNLRGSDLESIEIPVPPFSEQEKIVEHLDQISQEVKQLKSEYQSQLDNLEELKKSVLDKAFTGELVE